MGTNEKWVWSGKMIDCNGRISRFHINSGKDGVAGFLVELQERDGRASSHQGTAKIHEQDKQMVIEFEVPKEKQEQESFSYKAQLKQASPGKYANAAVFGTYESGDPNSVLGNGVIIMWQFS